MLEYRFSPEDDEEDFEEGAHINVDDDMGDYGMDDDEEEELAVVTGVVVVPTTPAPEAEPAKPEAPAKKPVKKAAKPKTADDKKPAPAALEAICCASISAGSLRGTESSRPCGAAPLRAFSSDLISSQRRFTSSAVSADPVPKTCG